MIHRNRKPRRSGATLVETAVVIGVALVFMFGIFEYGRYVMFRQLVENAAREGARQAVVSTTALTTTDIQATVTRYLVGQNLMNLTINVYKTDPTTGANLGAWNGAAFGEGIAIEVNGDYRSMLPSMRLIPSTVHIKAKAIMRSEAN